MTATTLPTPADLSITPRDRRFGRERRRSPTLARRARRSDRNLQRAVGDLPDGRGLSSSRACARSATARRPSSPRRSRRFTTQEAIHSREHDAFNKRAADAGYDLSKLEAQVEKRLAITARRPPIVSLAATMALEHFTAILAHQLLANPRHLAGAEQETADLWRWHAVEEIEHKGVAYDTWLHATRDWPRFKRWKVKAKVMLLRHPQFPRRPHRRRARADAAGRRDRASAPGRGCCGTCGCGRACSARSRARGSNIFLPGFHPWNEDDRHLLARL